MFIKIIRIENDGDLIREIKFRKGLNLIVDDSSQDGDQSQSGNNVGKTTVIRLVDFCLDGNGGNIYEDPEFPDKVNEEIKAFLTENNVIITLVLTEDLTRADAPEITIKRNFLKRGSKVGKKLLEINGETKTAKDFSSELLKKIFKYSGEKPSLKQLKAKNVRDEKNKVQNTLKVLNAYTPKSEYEALYLFLLGINTDVNARKIELGRDQNLQKKVLKQLADQSTIPAIEQSLIVINREIDQLEGEKEKFAINESYEEDLKNLNEIKSEVNVLSHKVSHLSLRKTLIEESLVELEQEKSDVDVNLIRVIYDNAKLALPKLQKTYEEAVTFHNEMVHKKSEYISSELPELGKIITSTQFELKLLIEAELSLSQKLKKSGLLEDLQKIISRLNERYEQRGRFEEQRRSIGATVKKLSAIEEEIADIDKGIISHEKEIESRVAKFNEYFIRISTELYDEQFILVPFQGEKGWDMRIDSIGANHGTGKKKGEIASFDLAYIEYADEMNIPCLHFVLQDQIENVHDNQITKLLGKIVDRVNCQYILPVLRDKLPDDIDVSKHEVLSLSQDNKLFKI